MEVAVILAALICGRFLGGCFVLVSMQFQDNVGLYWITMFMSNPFAELSASVSPTVMQTYIVVVALLVVGGTLFDIMHKKSATYFFNSWRNSTNKAKQQVGGGEMVAIAVQTAVVDVMASGEFCNMRRRVAHLLTMYGFVIYVVTTVIMVFVYPTPAAPTPA